VFVHRWIPFFTIYSVILLQYLVHFLKSLYDWLDQRCTRQIPIASTAWALLSDSYHGTLCLSHRPDVIAVAVLHVTLQCYGVSVPPQDHNDTRLQWWQVRVGIWNCKHREVKSLGCMLIPISTE